MKKSNRLKINISIIFALLFISTIIYNKYSLDKKIKHELELNIEEVKISINTTFHYFKKSTQNFNHFITNNTELINIISKANHSNETKKTILRERLKEILKLPYQRIKNVGAFQFHFVLPNNESFLRMHLPEKYGDRLTNIRHTYNYVHKNKKAISGFENGKFLHSFRYVYPLFDKKNNYIGAYEVSTNSDNIQKTLTNLNKLHNHFIIRKELFSSQELSSKKVLKNFIPSIEHKNFIFNSKGEHLKLAYWGKHLIEPNKKLINKNIKYAKEFTIYEELENSVKTILFIPINNILGENSAYLVVYNDNKHIYNLLQNHFTANLFIIISLIIISIYIYTLLTQKYNLKKEIGKQTKELKKSANIINEFVLFSRTDKDGKIIEVSDAFCKITGYKKDELIGKTHKILRHPDFYNNPIYKLLWDTLLEGKTWRGEVKNISKDKVTYWMDTTITPEYDNNHILIGYKAYRHNISNQKNLENMNKKQEQLILKQEKIVALGNMMDAIAHQWKQPLSLISMNMQNLNLKYELKEKILKKDIKKAEEEIKEQVNHLVTTIDEFRTFFRPNQKLLDTNIENLIKSTLKLMKNELINNKIETEINIAKDIEIQCIPNELKHVFINLINNSKDAFNENHIENRLIKFNIEQTEKNTKIKICDNAGGVESNILNKIFDANFTTKNNKGTGIGLYLTYQIIDKLNGTIKAENIESGVCIIITLKN